MDLPDEIYSPEASDTARFGDWQTKLAAALILIAIALVTAGISTAFGKPICLRDYLRLKTGDVHLLDCGTVRKGFVEYDWPGWEAHKKMLCRRYGKCRTPQL
jgi:hypothetical protein